MVGIMTLGEKIKLFRDLKGYSQEAMADSLGLSGTGYGKIERDETDVTVARLEEIATVLGVKVENITSFDEKVVFHNYSGSLPHNFARLQNYYHESGALEPLKALYESRITRFEDEVTELRRQLFDLLKK